MKACSESGPTFHRHAAAASPPLPAGQVIHLTNLNLLNRDAESESESSVTVQVQYLGSGPSQEIPLAAAGPINRWRPENGRKILGAQKMGGRTENGRCKQQLRCNIR